MNAALFFLSIHTQHHLLFFSPSSSLPSIAASAINLINDTFVGVTGKLLLPASNSSNDAFNCRNCRSSANAVARLTGIGESYSSSTGSRAEEEEEERFQPLPQQIMAFNPRRCLSVVHRDSAPSDLAVTVESEASILSVVMALSDLGTPDKPHKNIVRLLKNKPFRKPVIFVTIQGVLERIKAELGEKIGDGVVIDVGANVGMASFVVVVMGFRVLVFEPILENLQRICDGIYFNRVGELVTVFEAAASDHLGNITIHKVWSLVRGFDQPQKYKPFVSRCTMNGELKIGSLREVNVKSGLPATTSTERLELLDDEEHIFSIRIVGGDHRIKNYSSIVTLHPEIIDERPGTLVIESFVVDVPEGNTKEETICFVKALINCNLISFQVRISQIAYTKQKDHCDIISIFALLRKHFGLFFFFLWKNCNLRLRYKVAGPE